MVNDPHFIVFFYHLNKWQQRHHMKMPESLGNWIWLALILAHGSNLFLFFSVDIGPWSAPILLCNFVVIIEICVYFLPHEKETKLDD